MPPSQEDDSNKAVRTEVCIQKMPERVAGQTKVASPTENTLAAKAETPQFPYRVLVVDDEASIRDSAAAILEGGGYEVHTAADGLEGLKALSKSLPDMIISDLDMPRMSGFEFLAVVRKRFPHIPTIAISGEYITSEDSSLLADAFLQKGHYTIKQLFLEVAKLLAASPIRSEREKSDIAPLFVPRDKAGYLLITCPKCLRPSKVESIGLNGGVHQTLCQSCGSPVNFEINHEIEPLIKRRPAC
jgi:CheY-like chemotaxis protein